jgi:aminoglycoside N3'-acetyltransferase
MSATKDLLKGHLRQMGIDRGETVLIHSSKKAIGRVEPGPEAAVETFLEHLGPEGTLVVPTIIQSPPSGAGPLNCVRGTARRGAPTIHGAGTPSGLDHPGTSCGSGMRGF